MKRSGDSMIEEAALDWFRELGYTLLTGNAARAVGVDPWRDSNADVVLSDALQSALRRLNPAIPDASLHEAFRYLLAPSEDDLLSRNRTLWQHLVNGIEVKRPATVSAECSETVRLLDFESPDANDWIVATNFVVSSDGRTVIPDVVVFVNGIPLGVLELKFFGTGLGARDAIDHILSYQEYASRLFEFNAVIAVSDGVQALLGPIGAGREGFRAWRSVSGEVIARGVQPDLRTLIQGVFEPARFLQLVRHFILFEDRGNGRLRKWVATYYQFHAANVAVQETLRAMAGDRRIGVVWHATGAGRSMTTLLYVRRLLDHPQLSNVAIVILSDRTILDLQMHEYFQHFLSGSSPPIFLAQSRSELRHALAGMHGGVLFSTIQKLFSPQHDAVFNVLSDRTDLVVIANDAHRSQRGAFGEAVRASLPNAAFIGFTGVPLHLTERSAQAIFGDYISVYDLQSAVEDGVAVPIYYEERRAPQRSLNEDLEFAAAFDVALRDEFDDEPPPPPRVNTLEAMLTRPPFLEALARDIVEHFEKRRKATGGKAMVACLTRRMSVELYEAITRLRPAWHGSGAGGVTTGVVISEHYGDPPAWHATLPREAEEPLLAQRFRDSQDSFSLVIVCDKWLTGFDVPVLSTLYLCKPMRGHVLLQAVSRLMRPFPGKHGGLVVDYVGLTREMSEAFAAYWKRGVAVASVDSVIRGMRDQHQICVVRMRGFDWSAWNAASPAERARLLPAAQDHILSRQGVRSFLQAARELWRDFSLVVPNEVATEIQDDVGFFLAVRAALNLTLGSERGVEEDSAPDVREYLAHLVPPGTFADIFHMAGLEAPANGDLLHEELLRQIERMPYRHLALEVAQTLLRLELRSIGSRNRVLTRLFTDLVRSIQLEQLLELARELRVASRERGAALGLREDELAYYDAIDVDGSVERDLGTERAKAIAREIVSIVRSQGPSDWRLRESGRKALRMKIWAVLERNGYPEVAMKEALTRVMAQADVEQ
jgi:type I restriction enzyme, R subunit